jgi:hypothetical protein
VKPERNYNTALTPEMFWARVDKSTGPDGCWEWDGAKNVGGYGMVHWAGKRPVTHRVAYELAIGPIPDGLTLDHLCRNPGCCNPAHLEPVTMRENILRGTQLAAKNAAKTHCKRGHPFDAGNTKIHIGPNGHPQRGCRACSRLRSQGLLMANHA